MQDDSGEDDFDVLLLAHSLLIDDGAEDLDEEQLRFLRVFGYILVRAHQAGEDCRARRRRYLLREDLLPNPRETTPWQQLYQTQNDRAYIVTMGFDVNAFNRLLSAGFEERWNTRVIYRPDVQHDGRPRLGRRSLDAAGALGLVLHWLSSTMREVSLQQIFALIPSTVSRYLRTSIDLLLETVRDMPEARIAFPRRLQEFEYYNSLIIERHPHLQGAFASGDGLNLAVQVSPDDDIENATYSGWKHDHMVGNVISFAPNGTSSGWSLHFQAY